LEEVSYNLSIMITTIIGHNDCIHSFAIATFLVHHIPHSFKSSFNIEVNYFVDSFIAHYKIYYYIFDFTADHVVIVHIGSINLMGTIYRIGLVFGCY